MAAAQKITCERLLRKLPKQGGKLQGFIMLLTPNPIDQNSPILSGSGQGRQIRQGMERTVLVEQDGSGKCGSRVLVSMEGFWVQASAVAKQTWWQQRGGQQGEGG